MTIASPHAHIVQSNAMPDLFTYGSLMYLEIMERVSGLRLLSRPATLPGYQRSRLLDLDYPGIFSNDQASVDGILYLNLPDSALQRLDAFEGDQYRRQEVMVTLDDGDRRPAMAYVLRTASHSLITGEPWNYALFLATGKERFLANYGGFLQLPETS